MTKNLTVLESHHQFAQHPADRVVSGLIELTDCTSTKDTSKISLMCKLQHKINGTGNEKNVNEGQRQ